MTDDLTMAAGELPLIARQEGMIKAYARSGPKGVWLDGTAQRVKERFVLFRYGESGRRPSRPLPRSGQSGKPAADVVATVVALPPGIGKFNPTQSAGGFFVRVHEAGGTSGLAQPAFIAVVLLGRQGVRGRQLGVRNHGTQNNGRAFFFPDDVAGQPEVPEPALVPLPPVRVVHSLR